MRGGLELMARHGEREVRVRLRRTEGGYEVTVGERTWRVGHAAPAPGVLSLIVRPGVGTDGAGGEGAHREVTVRRLADGSYAVAVAGGAGVASVVDVADPLTHLARQSAGGASGKKSQRVAAYMPGRVVAVLAQEGEEVRAGQGVVVLEAMKMQNEIQAEHDGVLSRVFVAPGQAVEGGDPLFEME